MKEIIITSIHISKLDLSNLNLKEIPSVVFELKNLRKLNLSNNQITSIPIEIIKLKQLEILDISNNNVSNFFAKLCELKNLKTLNLNNNKIASIPKQISRLEKLRILTIANNKIKTLPTEFSDLTKLVTLNISKNLFTEFPESIYNLKELKQLWISNLNFKKFSVNLISINLIKLNSIYTYGASIDKSIADSDYFELSKVKGNAIGKLIEIVQDLKYRSYDNELSEKENTKILSIENESSKINNKSMIFICYSHQDIFWLKKVQTNLRVLNNQNIHFDLWDDTNTCWSKMERRNSKSIG